MAVNEDVSFAVFVGVNVTPLPIDEAHIFAVEVAEDFNFAVRRVLASFVEIDGR